MFDSLSSRPQAPSGHHRSSDPVEPAATGMDGSVASRGSAVTGGSVAAGSAATWAVVSTGSGVVAAFRAPGVVDVVVAPVCARAGRLVPALVVPVACFVAVGFAVLAPRFVPVALVPVVFAPVPFVLAAFVPPAFVPVALVLVVPALLDLVEADFAVAPDFVVVADFAVAPDFVVVADFAVAPDFVVVADFAVAPDFVVVADFAVAPDRPVVARFLAAGGFEAVVDARLSAARFVVAATTGTPGPTATGGRRPMVARVPATGCGASAPPAASFPGPTATGRRARGAVRGPGADAPARTAAVGAMSGAGMGGRGTTSVSSNAPAPPARSSPTRVTTPWPSNTRRSPVSTSGSRPHR
jgi:hypothetical protein